MNSDRRSFLKRNVVLSGGLLFAGSLNSLGKASQKINTRYAALKSVNIRYTNDLCSQTESFLHELGGLRAIANSVERQEESALLFDAGGFIDASNSLKQQLKGIDLMNKLGYAAVNLSGAEFSAGTANLTKLIPYLNFPLVSANYHFECSVLQKAISPFITFKYGNFKIGVTGVGGKLSQDGIKVYDPHEALRKVTTLLKHKHQCDLVICLTHLNTQSDKAFANKTLAEQSEGVNLFIGGHQSNQVTGLMVFKNAIGQDTFLSHNHPKGLALSQLTFSFNDDATLINVSLNHEIPSLYRVSNLAKIKTIHNQTNTI